MEVDKILFAPEEIRARVRELAAKINAHYVGLGADSVTVVGVLKGAVVFFADLVRELKLGVEFDFVKVSSYVGTESTREPKLTLDLSGSVTHKHVLIVEDILDTGHTLRFLSDNIKTREPLSVQTATLFDKPSRRENGFVADYVGFEIPDLFIVGYGLDCDGEYRQLPFVASLKTK
ncbi:MAG: hypoxanthine phosphoribosyltransferase [Oscillospiraceae bacterium]|jgi:hypoxanthine phosphoribosyltransferase|nr:hypoxanthine phosphoribosyltransferase [Oscillospiraceae bacterium]